MNHFIQQAGFSLFTYLHDTSGFKCRLKTAAPSVFIYRFVCHPSIAYVCPTIVNVTGVLIPTKAEVDDGERSGAALDEVCYRIWRSLVVTRVEIPMSL